MTMSIGNAGAAAAVPASGAASNAAAAGTSAQTAGEGFGQLLVQQTSAEQAAEPEGGALPVQLVTAGIVSQELAALLTGSTGDGLASKLDELIRLSEQAGERTEAQEAELDAALEHLNALMMSLFGIPLVPDNKPLAATVTDEGAASDEAAALAGRDAKPNLPELLGFLKSFLQDGLVKPLGKRESALFHAALDKLSQALAAQDGQTGAEAAVNTEGTAQVIVAGEKPSRSALLDRLGKQPLNAAVAAVAAEAASDGAKPAQGEAAKQAAQTLPVGAIATAAATQGQAEAAQQPNVPTSEPIAAHPNAAAPAGTGAAEAARQTEAAKPVQHVPIRSEERRVGKECRL